MADSNTIGTPQTTEKDYGRRLVVAKTVMWATRPLNRVTMWAARVVAEDRLRKGNLWADLDCPSEGR